ncbi:cellulase [Madurella fahalii]|uniref:lytic cellulose monooxygenase (C4-dehydrogenating) n=1 Tax=Madurella fahalii TaxID=1157608 RepID=A0ABQ0GQJ5_9PEZI
MPPHISALAFASSLLTFLALPAPSLTHSHLSHIIINGELYHGFDPRPNQSNHPARVGWSSGAADDGFVSPLNYSHPDIICHTGGTSPRAHAPVRAGERIHVQWNGWPVGHVGPVLTYLARCESADGSGCTGADKTGLRWTKVDDSAPVLVASQGAGIGRAPAPALRWATDVLIAANNSWQVQLPPGLPTGPYVLRQEIIALHYAAIRAGAQNYPLCINLWVEGQAGAGGFRLDGFDAREFYRVDDPGVLVNVSAAMTGYVVPGPTVAAGAAPVPHAEQQKMVPRAEGTPVVVLQGTTTSPFGATATPAAAGRSGRFRPRI